MILPRVTPSRARRRRPHGSVLIIVLWVAFGLVSVTLYFAQSMSFELRAADNRVAAAEAEQAIAGATRYVSNLLATLEVPGLLPDPVTYLRERVPVGDATFWLLSRDDQQELIDQPSFGLVDEAGKLNLNTATVDVLQWLPRMTPELAAAIIDWRDADSTTTTGGAEDEAYQRLNPSYRCKNGRFESIDELRLVYGMTLEVLFGEDANRNGILDPNENDGDLSPPFDNRDGRLDPGILEYVTVYSREPNTRTNGAPRISLSSTNQQELASLLQERFGTDRANQALQQAGGARSGFSSVLEFYVRSGLSLEEFEEIESDLTVSTNSSVEGLVNVNTASEPVLECIPGIGVDYAGSLVAYRQSNPSSLRSSGWVVEVLGTTNTVTAGPYVTAHGYQFTADLAAVGHHGRGYRRVKFIYDTSDGTPRIVYRQDLSHLGWALGTETRQNLWLANEDR